MYTSLLHAIPKFDDYQTGASAGFFFLPHQGIYCLHNSTFKITLQMNEKDDTFLTFTDKKTIYIYIYTYIYIYIYIYIQFTEHTSFVLVGYDIVSFSFFFFFSNHNYMYIKNFILQTY